MTLSSVDQILSQRDPSKIKLVDCTVLPFTDCLTLSFAGEYRTAAGFPWKLFLQVHQTEQYPNKYVNGDLVRGERQRGGISAVEVEIYGGAGDP